LFALAALAFVSADNAEAQDSQPLEEVPVRVLLGPGIMALLSPGPGIGMSLSLALEATHFVALGEVFGARLDTSYYVLSAGGALGVLFGNGKNAPYALAGLGEVSQYGLTLTLEAGGVIGRSQRLGQIWIGARGFVLLTRDVTSDEPSPRLPILSVNLRIWF
jgi:hypothetical protein